MLVSASSTTTGTSTLTSDEDSAAAVVTTETHQSPVTHVLVSATTAESKKRRIKHQSPKSEPIEVSRINVEETEVQTEMGNIIRDVQLPNRSDLNEAKNKFSRISKKPAANAEAKLTEEHTAGILDVASSEPKASLKEIFVASKVTQQSKPVTVSDSGISKSPSSGSFKDVLVRIEKLKLPATSARKMHVRIENVAVSDEISRKVGPLNTQKNIDKDEHGESSFEARHFHNIIETDLLHAELETLKPMQYSTVFKEESAVGEEKPVVVKEEISKEVSDMYSHQNKCHPSHHITQSNFVSNLGLIKKSELPNVLAHGHRLHRAVGGKLRRVLKPKSFPDMASESLQKAVAFEMFRETNSDSDDSASPGQRGVGHKSRSLCKFLESKGTRSPRAGSANSSPNSTPRKILDPRKSLLASDTHSVKRRKDWLLAPHAPERKIPHSALLQQMLAAPRKNEEEDPNKRRSARNKDRRREWGHLLRAAPDEYEKPTQPGEIPEPCKRRRKDDVIKSKFHKEKKFQLKVEMATSKKGTLKTIKKKKSSKKPESASQKNIHDASIPVDILKKASQLLPGLRPELASEILAQTLQVTGPELLDLDDNEILQKVHESPKTKSKPSPNKKHISKAKSERPRVNLSSHITIKEEVQESETVEIDDNDPLPIISGYTENSDDSSVDCLIPHLCNVCWVNDHSYCFHQKRITRDLPPHGGCLHYVPCIHYRHMKDVSKKDCRMQGLYGQSYVLCYTTEINENLETDTSSTHITISGNKIKKSPVKSKLPTCFDDLLCKETMPVTDPPVDHTPRGTEVLNAQLQKRARQLESNTTPDMPDAYITAALLSEVTSATNSEEEPESDQPVNITEFAAEEIFGLFETEPEVPLMGIKHERDPRFVYHRDSLGRPRRRMPNTSKKTWDHAKMEMIIRQREMSELAASVLSEEGKVRLAELQEQTNQETDLQKELTKARQYPPREAKIQTLKPAVSGKASLPQTSRLKIRIVPAAAAEANPGLLKKDSSETGKSQKVVKVKIQRIDSGKVVISKVKDDGTGLDSAVEESSCTVTHSPLKNSKGKTHPNKVHIQGELFKNSDKILEQVIAREAARFVNQPEKDTQVVTVTLESERIDAESEENNVPDVSDSTCKKGVDLTKTETEIASEELHSESKAGNINSETDCQSKKYNVRESSESDIDMTGVHTQNSQESDCASFQESKEIIEPSVTADSKNVQLPSEKLLSNESIRSVAQTFATCTGSPLVGDSNNYKSSETSIVSVRPKDKWSVVGLITPKGLQPLTGEPIPLSSLSNTTVTELTTLPVEALSVKSGERIPARVSLDKSMADSVALQSDALDVGSDQSICLQNTNTTMSGVTLLPQLPLATCSVSPVFGTVPITMQTLAFPTIFSPVATQNNIILPEGIKRGHYKVSSLQSLPIMDPLGGDVRAVVSLQNQSCVNVNSINQPVFTLPSSVTGFDLLPKTNLDSPSLTELAQEASSVSPSATETNLLNQIESKVDIAKIGFIQDSLEQQLEDINDIIATEVPEQGGFNNSKSNGDRLTPPLPEAVLTTSTTTYTPTSSLSGVSVPVITLEECLSYSAESLVSLKWSNSTCLNTSPQLSVKTCTCTVSPNDSSATVSSTMKPVLGTTESEKLQTLIIPNDVSKSLDMKSPLTAKISSNAASILKSNMKTVSSSTLPVSSSVTQSICVQSEQAVLPKELQDQSTSLDDGSQVLTFTTKEIRQRNPKLLNYMKVILFFSSSVMHVCYGQFPLLHSHCFIHSLSCV